ncbi:MAG: formate/nitrite transporter family protein [Streptococcaceae bacterium]|nr:formate/nitrite transporter family protein [Streptococcaceae bacterium]
MRTPEETLEITLEMAEKKIHKPLESKLILGFIGGAMIALGYLAYVRVIASVVEEWGGFASFIGACVFPVGLIVILLAGGELITGNMMVISAGLFAKKLTLTDLLKNWTVITFGNILGALFVSYFFGDVVGLLTSGDYLTEALAVANAKISATPLQAFISGIGCNWFVGLALWLCYAAKDGAGKILAIWFPVMTFVAIGFQHSVANVFIVSFAVILGKATLMQLLGNFAFVYLGNIVGAAVFISLFYIKAYRH